MVDYALGDRGSVDIVTDDYYEAETLQIFEELHIDRERIWYGEARLVPEPDNPYEPNSIAVYIDEFKVGRMEPGRLRRVLGFHYPRGRLRLRTHCAPAAFRRCRAC